MCLSPYVRVCVCRMHAESVCVPLIADSSKRTSEYERNLSYLDISIIICGRKYVTEVYDKRDDFNFDIVNFPYIYV